jgi:hypothetical protein
MGFDAADGDVGNSRPAHYPPPPPAYATGSPPPPGQNHEAEHPTNVGMDLTKEDFEYVTSQVMRVADVCCNGRVVSVLEGGYGAYNPLTGFQREKPSRTTRAKAAGGNTNGGGSNGNGNGGSSTSNNGGTTAAPGNGAATTTQVHIVDKLFHCWFTFVSAGGSDEQRFASELSSVSCAQACRSIRPISKTEEQWNRRTLLREGESCKLSSNVV